eukprot:GGOE01061195.1.p1 GENE.GGOE01061195.1~~GGOE01061195.1.p1  ORF type:complete len:232 (+),score=17.86 GGOE01061195.1:69-764(+)
MLAWLPLRQCAVRAGCLAVGLRHASWQSAAGTRSRTPVSAGPKSRTSYVCFLSEHVTKAGAEWRAMRLSDRKVYQQDALVANRESPRIRLARQPPKRPQPQKAQPRAFSQYLKENFHEERAKSGGRAPDIMQRLAQRWRQQREEVKQRYRVPRPPRQPEASPKPLSGYNLFVAHHRRKGVPMADVGAKWRLASKSVKESFRKQALQLSQSAPRSHHSEQPRRNGQHVVQRT